jgi:hypothetical protein
MNINTDKVRKKDQSIIVDFYFDSTHFLFCPEKFSFQGSDPSLFYIPVTF